MHFEILIEDQSGKKALDILMPKIIEKKHTYRVISYRGIGRIPKNLRSHTDAHNRILLDRLPELLKGYGETYTNYPANYSAVVIVVCDKEKQQRASTEFENYFYRGWWYHQKLSPKPQTTRTSDCSRL